MNQQQRMMRQLSSMKFAAWELHIFLDTHPGNCEAARKKAEVDQRIEELLRATTDLEYRDKLYLEYDIPEEKYALK